MRRRVKLEKMVHYLQCQRHSDGLYNQSTTISAIFSKQLVCLQLNLAWWHSIRSLSVLWKKWITAFKVKVKGKVQNLNERLSGWYLLNRGTFCCQTWYGDAALFARVSCEWGWGGGIVCYLQAQGHSKGSYDQNMTVATISSQMLILLPPNLVWSYIIISQSVLWRNLIVVFKVKVTAKFQCI